MKISHVPRVGRILLHSSKTTLKVGFKLPPVGAGDQKNNADPDLVFNPGALT